MSFHFPGWTSFDAQFYRDATAMLAHALNKSPLPSRITAPIEITQLHLGTQPPQLQLLEIGELDKERFRGVFKLTYGGDAFIVMRTQVQANPLHPGDTHDQLVVAEAPPFAAKEFVLPLELRISQLKLHGIVVLVVSKVRGVTLSFKNDPLESVIVSSTFDGLPKVEQFLQGEIEKQLREVFREDLPRLVHDTSLRKLAEMEVKMAATHDDSQSAAGWRSPKSGRTSRVHSRATSPTPRQRHLPASHTPEGTTLISNVMDIMSLEHTIIERDDQLSSGEGSVIDSTIDSTVITGSPQKYTTSQLRRVAQAVAARQDAEPGLKKLTRRASFDDESLTIPNTMHLQEDSYFPIKEDLKGADGKSVYSEGSVYRARIVQAIKISRSSRRKSSKSSDANSAGRKVSDVTDADINPTIRHHRRPASGGKGGHHHPRSGWTTPSVVSPTYRDHRFFRSATSTPLVLSDNEEDQPSIERLMAYASPYNTFSSIIDQGNSDNEWNQMIFELTGQRDDLLRESISAPIDLDETIFATEMSKIPRKMSELSRRNKTLNPYVRPIEHALLRTQQLPEAEYKEEPEMQTRARRALRRKVVGKIPMGKSARTNASHSGSMVESAENANTRKSNQQTRTRPPSRRSN